MKKILKPIAVIFMITTMMSSCKNKNDDESNVTTVEEDKANLDLGLDNIISCINEAKNGKLMTSIVSFAGLSAGATSNDDWIDSLFTGLDSVILGSAIDDLAVDFSAFNGTFTYNQTNSEWVKTANASSIKILFPSAPSKATNNAEFTFNGYSYQNFTSSGDITPIPKSGIATLKVDGIIVLSVELNSLILDNTSTLTLPTKVDISITASPYTINVLYNRINDTDHSVQIDFLNPGGCDWIFDFNGKVKSSDYENMQDSDIDYVRGTITHDNVKFDIDVEVDKLAAYTDPTDSQINSNVGLKVLIGDQEIGDLEIVDSSGDTKVNIVYKDGTSEDTKNYWEPFITDLEAVFIDLTGA